MYSNILYVMATGCLFVGSILTYKNELPDYFYMAGTSLFLLKALLSLVIDIKNYRRTYDMVFSDI
jgi:hypothetical protein